MGLSLGAAIAAGNAHATEDILNDAIHDYSDDASRSFQSSSSQHGWGGYEVKIVLYEACHDYDISDEAAFDLPEPYLEWSEFAAFKEYSPGVASVSFTN